MSTHVRDLLAVTLLAAVARIAAALIVSWPPYTDPAYYSLVAQQLATGEGFTVPVLWSFLEVGSRIPDPAVLPVASNGHWMPLTSIVAAGSMALLGPSWGAGQVPIVILAIALVPFTYQVAWELFGSRWVAWVSAVLAIFAGPLLLMYSTIDNFAVFGVAGAAALYASVRAVRVARPGPWLVLAGIAAGLATLARIDGALLTMAPAVAWAVRRVWSPRRPAGGSAAASGATVGWGIASAAAYLVVLAPWLWRNLAEYGTPLPSAGGHTLWIRTYNEQFSIGHEVSVQSYTAWGPGEIIGSKLVAWGELVGRTGVLLGGTFLVFFIGGLWIWRRRPELAPFLVYFVVMFAVMGAVFTFHAPKGAFYHSAPAWLPFAIPMAVAAVGPVAAAGGRVWPFLRRPATHRFITVAGVGGALALSVAGSAILLDGWRVSRDRDVAAGAFLAAQADAGDVIMGSDPANLYPLTGLGGVAAPFDPYPVIERVVDAYGVDWVVVTRPGPGSVDPLGLWNGADARDIDGNRPAFLPTEPAFESGDVRVFRVNAATADGS